MKNKVINAAFCDAREVTEESLQPYDTITINTAVLLVGERAKELLNRYPVTMNAAAIIDAPDGKDIEVKTVNGSFEIGPETDGTGVFLMVNGRLTVANDSLEAVKSYYKIVVNGKILMPKSCRGQCQNLQISGKTEYYPDGAAILRANTQIDDLFVCRAANPLYYCPGRLFFLDTGIDTDKLLQKGLRFGAKKLVIAKTLVGKLLSQLDEEAELIPVPDGTRLIADDLELQPRTVRKYGAKLFVCGDVSIRDAEALRALEYLYADGSVRLDRSLEEAFDAVESVCRELKIIDADTGYISDRPMVKVGPAILKNYPNGVQIEDCAKVTLSAELSPGDILDKIRISDCAVVLCTKEQEEAVAMIAEDVAQILAAGKSGENPEEGTLGGLLGKLKDTQVVNAAEIKL